MPDGLYKTLPLAREWRSLLRHSEREADRGDRANASAERAVRADIKRELSRGFVRGLIRITDAAEAMLPGIRPFDGVRNGSDLGGEGSVLENDIARRLPRLFQNGLRGETLATRSVEEAISNRLARRISQIEQHCLVGNEIKVRPIIAAVKTASAGVNIKTIAESIVRSEKLGSSKPKYVVQLNENLLDPGR